MAGYTGIGKINGVAISGIGKITGRTKADVWSISSTPRESNLFSVLTNTGWGSFTEGNNYASFVADSTSSGGVVYFQVDNHTSGDTYNFTFDKVGTTASRIFELRISTTASLLSTTGGGSYDAGIVSGSISTSITASSTNTTLYIGFRQVGGTGANTFTINNLVVSRS